MKINIKLPITISFIDYHEIPIFKDNINKIFKGIFKIKCEELGLLKGKYVGIFFIKKNDKFHVLKEKILSEIEKEFV